MPSEVIDLISSSPPPHSTKNANPIQSTSFRACDSIPGVDLEGLTDEFDTTIDFDEIFSLSQLRSEKNNENPRALSGKRYSTAVEPELQDEPRSRRVKDTIIDINSDDFPTPGDLNSPTLAESTGNKRRKVSPCLARRWEDTKPTISAQRRSQDQQGASIRQPSYYAAAYDLIDVTGSPENLSPSRPNRTYLSTTKCWEAPPPNPHQKELSLSPDPFESSNPENVPCTIPSTSKLPDLIESSNPFVSSPIQEQPKSVAPTGGRRLDDIEIDSSAPPPPRATLNKFRSQNWDPISSSAPETEVQQPPAPQPRKTSNQAPIELDSESEPDALHIDSDDESDELPDLDQLRAAPRRPRHRTSFQRSHSDVLPSKSRSKPAKPTRSATEKAREREVKAAAKAIETERKKRKREQAKEAKARDKERTLALADANKIRTDKKVSTPEMLIDLPASMNVTTKTQAEAILEALDVHFTTWDSPVENVIKWRRKVNSRYNDDLGHWEPIPLHVTPEKHVAVIILAEEFVQLALSGGLDDHVDKMTQHFPDHHLVYLIEGLTLWMRRNRNARNRQFVSGVRGQEEASTSTNRRRNGQAPAEYVSEETIEDALLQLQVMYDVLIHHTNLPLETAQWVGVLTQHISTIPYRKQKDQATMGAAFCMESGQVRSGDDAKDTYIRLLQEIARVTAPAAYGIAAEFESVTQLVNGLESGGPNILEATRKSASKDGAVSERAIGQAVSKRLHKVFTGRDESSTEV